MLDYVNEYGLLGLIHDLPVNRYYTLDKKVLLKEFNNVSGKEYYDTFSCKNQENVYKSRAKANSNVTVKEEGITVKKLSEPKNTTKMSLVRHSGDSNALRFNRIPLECKKCGSKALSNISMGIYRCDKCGEENYDDYQTVRRYLDRVGMASATEIEQNTGVPRRVISYFFKEEYLEIPKSSTIRVPCERCGAPIRTGVLCDSCKNVKGSKLLKKNDTWHSRI